MNVKTKKTYDRIISNRSHYSFYIPNIFYLVDLLLLGHYFWHVFLFINRLKDDATTFT